MNNIKVLPTHCLGKSHFAYLHVSYMREATKQASPQYFCPLGMLTDVSLFAFNGKTMAPFAIKFISYVLYMRETVISYL